MLFILWKTIDNNVYFVLNNKTWSVYFIWKFSTLCNIWLFLYQLFHIPVNQFSIEICIFNRTIHRRLLWHLDIRYLVTIKRLVVISFHLPDVYSQHEDAKFLLWKIILWIVWCESERREGEWPFKRYSLNLTVIDLLCQCVLEIHMKLSQHTLNIPYLLLLDLWKLKWNSFLKVRSIFLINFEIVENIKNSNLWTTICVFASLLYQSDESMETQKQRA